MAYTNQTAILGYISLLDLVSLTDDTQTGNVDAGVLASVIQNVTNEIDGMLGSIYDVPFTNPPSVVQAAATVMACFALYDRRLTPEEKNPFKQKNDIFIEQFRAVGRGDRELDANTPRAFNPGYVQSTYAVLNQPMQ